MTARHPSYSYCSRAFLLCGWQWSAVDVARGELRGIESRGLGGRVLSVYEKNIASLRTGLPPFNQEEGCRGLATASLLGELCIMPSFAKLSEKFIELARPRHSISPN